MTTHRAEEDGSSGAFPAAAFAGGVFAAATVVPTDLSASLTRSTLSLARTVPRNVAGPSGSRIPPRLATARKDPIRIDKSVVPSPGSRTTIAVPAYSITSDALDPFFITYQCSVALDDELWSDFISRVGFQRT